MIKFIQYGCGKMSKYTVKFAVEAGMKLVGAVDINPNVIGTEIEGVKVVPKRVKIKKKDLEKNRTKIEITIVEGRNHIVKKIFEKIGHPVNKLHREREGFLTVTGMQSGDYRILSNDEVRKLKALKK